MKHTYEKSKFLEILSESPWITFASKKVGISRATVYRWMKLFPDFKEAVEKATKDGNTQLGEIAEMGLIKSIKEGNINAIKYYLSNNNPKYISKRSVFVIPHEEHHIIGLFDRCELCGRADPEKIAKHKELEKKIEEFADPENKEAQEEMEKLYAEMKELEKNTVNNIMMVEKYK